LSGINNKNSEFNNKRVLITGASKGLGWVCAQFFEQCGAQLIVTGRTTEKLEELISGFSEPDKHLSVTCDLLEKTGVDDLVKQVNTFCGDIDIIIHALGGGYGFRAPLLSWDQFDMLHRVNVAAGAEINRQLIPSMQARNEGRVIHICSVASQEATGSVGYNTAKAALAAYVRSLGRELASDGVVVSGILPGAFYAPGNSWERLEARDPAVVKHFVETRLPRNKIAEADEIMPLIALLAGEGASMMAGTCIAIDAGEGVSYV
jgi:3-oxoacyl-[acyl-carrier protein] reductase